MHNPVAGPYFNFTVPEAMGVVGIICPKDQALLGLTQRLAPVICSGNVAVVVPSESRPEVALDFAEVVGTSDVPAGVINIVSGLTNELLKPLASHMDVNAIEISGLETDQQAVAQELSAANVKRSIALGEDSMDSPYAISSFTEFKTIWHPIGQ
jgi:acyl-CoA reductase-like NAD-dependent aldehyde dehydrogenase